MWQGYVTATRPLVWTDSIIIMQHQVGGNIVPAACPIKFNKLNFLQHVAGTFNLFISVVICNKRYRLIKRKQKREKITPAWCCTIIILSIYTRERVTATYPWGMFLPHFFVCVSIAGNFVPAACFSSTSLIHVPQCVLHVMLPLLHVTATCHCDMSLH